MKYNTVVFKADELNNELTIYVEAKKGVWVAARPVTVSKIDRIKAAIGVLFGKYDALKWHKQ